MKTSSLRLVGLSLCACVFLIGLLVSAQSPTVSDPIASYDPADYGLPEFIEGYRLVAVRNSGNTACMIRKEITVQPVENVSVMSLVNPRNNALAEIQGINDLLDDGWLVGIVGAHVTREGIIEQNEDWNTLMQQQGCVRLGPVMFGPPAARPTP